jgi:DNA helicase-2/ATP-dependent DNA helicase PcrA
MDYLDELNPAQRAAATHKDGPLLIVAGAGAGKTRTVAYRVRHLIESGVEPRKILAVTFTNKAAREMRERILALVASHKSQVTSQRGTLDSRLSTPLVSTFHALGVQILRESGEAIGISRHFTILDRSDSISLIRKIIRELGHDPKQFQPDRILGVISRQKADLADAEIYAEENGGDYYGKIVAAVWRKYEERLAKQKSLDFDNLISKVVELFREKPDILSHYQDQWHYLHIDEYQDTNRAQYEFARLLAEKRKNICVVGDIDQSIYSWRGADFNNILNFEKDYPNAATVVLEENYRSTKTILAAAADVISKNVMRKEKNLFTNNADGGKIDLFQALDENEEAGNIVEKVREIAGNGTPTTEIAVLYRANFQSRVLEDAFLHAHIPYQLVGTRFFERREVKDVIAYLRAALNSDDLESFGRIINVPPRGIGETTLDKIINNQTDKLSPMMKEKLAGFMKLLDDVKSNAQIMLVSELIKFIIESSGLEKSAAANGEDERVENMRELVTLATKYNSLPGQAGVQKFLEDAALASDQDDLLRAKNGVRLMTVHAAKGLEFRHVFIVGLEQDLFPHRRLDESSDEEEERRLFYVALTRAKEKLHLSYAATRTIFGSRQFNIASEFLNDITDDLIEKEIGQSPVFNRNNYGQNNYSDDNNDSGDIIRWDTLNVRSRT